MGHGEDGGEAAGEKGPDTLPPARPPDPHTSAPWWLLLTFKRLGSARLRVSGPVWVGSALRSHRS